MRIEGEYKMRQVYFLSFMVFILGTSNSFAEGFSVSSADISGQLSKAQVFSGWGCKGDNISPKLKWSNPPKGTKSFAVTVYDPDAPTGSGWWHWLIFNIPAAHHELKQGAGNLTLNLAPKGAVQSVTSYGTTGYGGACPPKGDQAHRYIFTVFALNKAQLKFDEKTMPAIIGYQLNANSLAKASIMAYYQRK